MASKQPTTESSLNKAAVKPIPTPTYPTGGVFTVLTTIAINAPLSKVLDLSLDTSTWPSWNTYVPKVDILSQPSPTDPTSQKLQVGTKVTHHNRQKKDGPTSAKFSDSEVVSIEEITMEGEKGWRIVWKTIGMPNWLLRTERVQELIEKDGKVEYKTWGTFGGPMAYLLSWFGVKADVVDRFGDWAEGLKDFAEGGQE